jgi:hypothetical protein
MVDHLKSWRPVDAWTLLYEHPALSWIPPMLRNASEAGSDSGVVSRHAVRAIERNLLVNVRTSADGRCLVALSTGPLVDRELADGVDPVAPAAAHDNRLDVEADTFEDALCALARRVVEVYGPSSVGAGRRVSASNRNEYRGHGA